MKLKKMEIQGFRSIREPQVLNIDPFVTVLIGANDHGKTNLLEAIRALNNDRPFTDKDRNWDCDDPADCKITYHFAFDAEEKTKLRRLLKPETVEVVANPVKAIEGLAVDLAAIMDEMWSVTFSRDGKGNQLIMEPPSWLLTGKGVEEFIVSCMPRVELFEPVGTSIKDIIGQPELNEPANEFMQGIFRKAGLWDQRSKIFQQNPRTEKLLAEASERLTSQIQQEWEQGGELAFRLSHAPGGIALRILDPAVSNTYVLPSQRSSGFSAFFVLHFRLFARQEAHPANKHFYIFDEPGTYLHPRGQINLIRVFETLSQKNQLAYATHSIFMVNKNEPARHRVVLKGPTGTVIDQKPYLSNWKSVRSSLGLFFSNNFFFAEATLLVEGPSDVLYVLSILKMLGHFGKIDIDLNLFSIRDGGNQSDFCAMARLMAEEGRRVVAVLDGDQSGKQAADQLVKINAKLDQERLIEIVTLQANCSIEDYAPFKSLLVSAVIASCRELVDAGARKYRDGYKEDEFAKQLSSVVSAQQNVKTLGKIVEEKTAEVFNPREKVSKLQIARNYEDAVENLLLQKNSKLENFDLALQLVESLKGKLKLKPKEARKAIFAPLSP